MDAKQKIMKTAIKLFSEKGYHAVSIREIAAKAKLNSSLINYYFKSKQGLYESILREHKETVVKERINYVKNLNVSAKARIIELFKNNHDDRGDQIFIIIFRSLLDTKEKKIQSIIKKEMNDIECQIKHLLSECTIREKYKNKISKNQVFLFILSMFKNWLIYTNVLIDNGSFGSKNEIVNNIFSFCTEILTEILE